MSLAITSYDRMRAELVQAHRIDEVKNVRDKAEALRKYLKMSGESLENQNMMAEIRLRSDRRSGELLGEMKENGKLDKGGRPVTGDTVSPAIDPPKKLADLGLTKKQSSRLQAVAAIPEEVFEQYIVETKETKKELTSGGVQELAKEINRETKKQEKEAEKQALPDLPPSLDWDGVLRPNVVSVASIDSLVLPESSIDMIFTDPPYHDEYIELYCHLARMAASALKPGAYLMTYAGKMFLPQVHQALGAHLEYVSEFAVFHPFSQSRIQKHLLFENWRPIVAYKRPGTTAAREWVQDVIRGERSKEHHDWQQDEQAPLTYIEAYTKPGDLVLDPFCGGGTTPSACQQIKRRYIAFDRSEDAVRTTIKRLTANVS